MGWTDLLAKRLIACTKFSKVFFLSLSLSLSSLWDGFQHFSRYWLLSHLGFLNDYSDWIFNKRIVWSGLPVGLRGKESACQAGNGEMWVLFLDWEDLLEEEMATHSCLGKFHGQRSLAGYRFRGLQKSQMQLSDWACTPVVWSRNKSLLY